MFVGRKRGSFILSSLTDPTSNKSTLTLNVHVDPSPHLCRGSLSPKGTT